MSERCENNEDNSSKMNNSDDDLNHNEYPPNVVRFDPDIGLGNQQNNRKRRSSGSHPRREESSISFRHFLQNEVGQTSNTSYPDLYSCSRQERALVDGSIVDPESPDLPDFVQDHLAVEHMYFNNGSNIQSINVQNLPDFASCMPRDETEIRLRQQLSDNEPQENASTSLPFDLTTQASVASSACDARNSADIEPANSGGGRLPDFLSDGHVLAPNNTRHREARVAASENGIGLEAHAERHNLISMLRHENDRLRNEVSILQSVLTKKDDRIKELEDLVTALEISKLQMSTDANTQTPNKSVDVDEANCSKKSMLLSKNVGPLSKEHEELPCRFTKQLTNSNFTEKMLEMTSTSEHLVRELLKIIVQMQQNINQNDTSSSSSKHKFDEDRNDAGNDDSPSKV